MALVFGSFISCQNGIVDPEPIPQPIIKFTIEASVVGQGGSVSPTQAVVIKGGSVDFSITPNVGYKQYSITVNGIKLPLASTTYSIMNVASDYKIEVAFVSDNFLILNKGADDKTFPWHLKNLSYYNDKGVFLDSLLLVQTPERLTNNMYYYSTGKYESWSKDGKTLVANGKWDFDGQVFIDWDKRCPVLKINDGIFIYDCPPFVDTDGTITHQRVTLVR